MTSLRLRLFAALSLALLVALGAGGTLLYCLVARGLVDEVDARLDASLLPALDRIAELADGRADDEDAGGITAEYERRLESEFADPKAGIRFEAIDDEGRVVARSPSLGDGSLAPPAPFDGERVHYNLLLPDGARGRALAIHTAGRTVLLARERDSVLRRLNALRSLLFVVGAATWLSASLVGRLALRRGLAPFDRFVARVERVDPDGAGESFDAAALPAELAPIAGKLEQLLARLRGALARERRFNSAVAHELRTPVAELRAIVDVALAGERDAEALELALRDVDGATSHLDSLVRALLSLRRGGPAAQGPSASDSETIGLREQLDAAIERANANGGARRIVTNCTLDGAAAAGDASRLRSILDNLLWNALEYAPAQTTITVDARAAEAQFVVSVRNRRPAGLASDDLERFFEPFWSKAPHGGAAPHCGLGLFIARSFAEASGWQLAARLEGDEVVVALSGPCGAPSPNHSRS